MEIVESGAWHRASGPRCRLCGGMLEQEVVSYAKRANTKYGDDWTKELRSAVRSRDGQRCLICGKTNAKEAQREGHGLSVHHIDHDKSNSRMSNLAALCCACHTKRAHGKKATSWKATLREMLKGSEKKHSWATIQMKKLKRKKYRQRRKAAKAKLKRTAAAMTRKTT